MTGFQARVSRTIARELSAAAAECADDAAVYFGAEQRTFSEYRRDVWQAALGLVACGVKPGDRIALWMPNTLEGATALLGVMVAGATAVPLNTRYRGQEVAKILERARCRLIIVIGEFLGRSYAAEMVEVAGGVPVLCAGADGPAGTRAWTEVLAAGSTDAHRRQLAERIGAQLGDEITVVQYTSGTTGRAKGVALRQAPMLATSAAWSDIVGLGPGDVYPVTYPIAHIGGYKTGLLSTLVARAGTVLIPIITTETLVDTIRFRRPTVLNGPPPVLRSLLAAIQDRQLPASTRIRTVITGSSMVPPQLIRELARDLGVADVINAFGITEASGVCTMTRRGDPVDLVCETVGRPIPGVEVRIAPTTRTPESAGTSARTVAKALVGEIEVNGPNVMAGYLEDPEATREAMHGGWLRTGDIGWIGADGYIRIAGRAKDMIIVGGFNVFPAEIEHVLMDHPDVAEAAVVGVPDERLGEVPVAFIVPAAGPLATDGLIQWCRDRLANFKVPRHVWLTDSLPRVTAGKILKPQVRDRAIELVAAALIPEKDLAPDRP
jgi:acyl-CoA synthetase (AMP-forming)/AMP-acid ligase II